MVRLSITLVCLAVVLAAFGARRWWNAPATVPDHATHFSGTQQMLFSGSTVLAQPVRPTKNRFTAVDLIVAAESAALPGRVVLEVRDIPSGAMLRRSELPAARAPSGDAWNARAGSGQERWLSFGFEPIEDSSGHDYLLLLSYPPPDGINTPGRRLTTLARSPNSYAPGSLRINGDPSNGVLLARLAAAGTHGLAVQVAWENVARSQPLVNGTWTAPLVCTLLALTLASALAQAVIRISQLA